MKRLRERAFPGGSEHEREQAQRAREDAETRDEYRQYYADGQILLGGSGFGLEIDRSLAVIMAFDHRRRMVLVNPDRVFGKNLSTDEKRYVFSHEIAHFVQLVSDPNTYLRAFDLPREKAKEAPAEYADQVQKLWGRFYNVFLDIQDNATVDRCSMWTQNFKLGTHPRATIYNKKLTQEDMSGGPKTEQFLFGVLRRAMLGVDAPLKIDDDVSEVLDSPFTYLGNKYENFFEFARKKFFDADLPLNILVSVLERFVAPLFEKFIKMDQESGEINNATCPVDMDGADMDLDQMRDLIKQVKDANTSPSDKAATKEREEFSEAMKGGGFSDSQIARMLEIRERANEVYRSLVDLWGVFVQTTFTTDVVEDAKYRSGHAPDVNEFIRQFPDYVSQPDRLRLFLRRFVSPEVESEKPKLIELQLVLDLSGSMDKAKRQAVQEAAYALSKSLVQFKRDKDMLAGDQGSGTDINLRFVGFGSSVMDLFDRNPDELRDGVVHDNNPSELDERLWRAILAIETQDLVGTQDALALLQVHDEVTDFKRLQTYKDGDRVSVVIEITDGVTTTQDQSREIVDLLSQQPGVYPRAIQIPGGLLPDFVNEDDQGQTPYRDHTRPTEFLEPTQAFEAVWGDKGVRLDDVGQLRVAMMQLVFDALRERAS
jgi:hypothetical protein